MMTKPRRAAVPMTCLLILGFYALSGTSAAPRKNLKGGGEKSKKPLLVFHVGPFKTGSTSLQTGLSRLHDVLLEDGYYYGGKHFGKDMDNNSGGRISMLRTPSPLHKSVMQVFTKCNDKRNHERCPLEEIQNALEGYRWKGTNVIFSDESFTSVYFHSPQQFQALHDALSDDWELMVVAAYRHFFEWVPSWMFQNNRLDVERAGNTVWPGRKGGHSLEDAGARLFPDTWKSWVNGSSGRTFTSDLVHDDNNGVIPLQIISMYPTEDGMSERSQLVCTLLPDSPKACEKSREMDHGEDIHVNSNEAATHFFYDALTTEAAEKGMVKITDHKRTTVREAIRDHTEGVLGGSHKTFDVVCPHEDELNAFLDASIDRQKKVFQSDFTAEMEDEHRAKFQKAVDSNQFCWVDTDAVLEQTVWRDFFDQYK